MSRLIYITEAQLNEIVGNGTYLDDNDTTNEYRLGQQEVSADGITGSYIDGDLENGKPVMTDKIAKQITNPRVRGIGGYAFRRNILPESNQDLTGKQNTMQISQTTIDKLKEKLQSYNGSQNDPGVKRAQRIINTGRVSNDDGYRILNDFETGKAGEALDDSLQKEIRKRLDTAEDISQNGRDAKKERGEKVLKQNYNSATIGKAHTPKGNNIIGVTYEN